MHTQMNIMKACTLQKRARHRQIETRACGLRRFFFKHTNTTFLRKKWRIAFVMAMHSHSHSHAMTAVELCPSDYRAVNMTKMCAHSCTSERRRNAFAFGNTHYPFMFDFSIRRLREAHREGERERRRLQNTNDQTGINRFYVTFWTNVII